MTAHELTITEEFRMTDTTGDQGAQTTDAEQDAARTPAGQPDGTPDDLIDPATLPPIEPGSAEDESSEDVQPA